jgi:UDP-glucose 4-epimerase
MRCDAINLGTGQGSSVLDVVKAFERVNGVRIPYALRERQPGDVAACSADPALALAQLGWRTQRTLDDMCRDAWAWQRASAHG